MDVSADLARSWAHVQPVEPDASAAAIEVERCVVPPEDSARHASHASGGSIARKPRKAQGAPLVLRPYVAGGLQKSLTRLRPQSSTMQPRGTVLHLVPANETAKREHLD